MHWPHMICNGTPEALTLQIHRIQSHECEKLIEVEGIVTTLYVFLTLRFRIKFCVSRNFLKVTVSVSEII